MKKIRIESHKSGNGKAIEFFTTAEALYLWMKEGSTSYEEADRFVINVANDEFLEIEWQGCEFTYEEDGTFYRLDIVRMAKAKSTILKNSTVGINYGWTCDTLLKFKDSNDSDGTVTVLNDPSESRLDLDVLFKDLDKDDK